MRRVVLVLLGAYVCLLASVVHRHTARALGVDWPWGLVLALAVSVVVALGAERVQRVGAAWFGLGWAALLVLQQLAPGDSYLVAADALGWTFTSLGLGGIAVVVVRASRLER